jgi:hypothetical protein
METKEKKKQSTTTVPNWEFKNRTYYLAGNLTPLTLRMQAKSNKRSPLLWFDKEKGYNREIRYATNQMSPFVDEQDDNVLLGHVVFYKGVLKVPKENQVLQKIMSLYHPGLGKRFYEFNPVEDAKDDLDFLDIQVDAMTIARSMDIDQAEAIMRVEYGSDVAKMSSKELKRDLILFASKDPQLFISLANDENVMLRNFGILACENKIIKLSQDQRTFNWTSNGRKLMTIPFDENPYSALAAWFKTDEGVEVFKTIKKKLQ